MEFWRTFFTHPEMSLQVGKRYASIYRETVVFQDETEKMGCSLDAGKDALQSCGSGNPCPLSSRWSCCSCSASALLLHPRPQPYQLLDSSPSALRSIRARRIARCAF